MAAKVTRKTPSRAKKASSGRSAAKPARAKAAAKPRGKKAPAKKTPGKKAPAKEAPGKKGPAKKAAGKTTAKKSTSRARTAARSQPARKGVGVDQVHLGHVFTLRPRVSTSFRHEDFRRAKHDLGEERYGSVAEAARAVVERALELTEDGKRVSRR